MKKIILLLLLLLTISFVSAETYFFEDFQNTTLTLTPLNWDNYRCGTGSFYHYYGKENLEACYVQSAGIYIDKKTEGGNNYLHAIWTYDEFTGNYDSIIFNKSINLVVDNTTTLSFKGRQNQSGVNHPYNQARFIFHFTDGNTGNILVGTNFTSNYLYEQCVLPQEDILNNTDKIVVVNLKDFTDKFNKTQGWCNFEGKTIDSFAFRYSLSGVQTDYLLDDINLSSSPPSCTIPTTNMSITSNTTFCSGDYEVYGITIDANEVTLDFESNTRLFFPNATQSECLGTPCYNMIQVNNYYDTIDCNNGLIQGWNNGDNENPYGTFGIDLHGTWNNSIQNCELTQNLHPIASWVDGGNHLFESNNWHDNLWQTRAGGNNSVFRYNTGGNLLAIGSNVMIEDNTLDGLGLGYTPPEGDLECLTEDAKFSGIARRNTIGSNGLVMGCRYPEGRMNVTLNSVSGNMIVFGRNASVTLNNISSVDTWWSEINDSEFIGNKFTGNTQIRGKNNIVRSNDFDGTGRFECQLSRTSFEDCVDLVFEDNRNLDRISIAGTNINITNSDTADIYFYGDNFIIDNLTATTGFQDDTESVIRDLVFKNSNIDSFNVQAGISNALFIDNNIPNILSLNSINDSVVTQNTIDGLNIIGINNQVFNNTMTASSGGGGCSFTGNFNVSGNIWTSDVICGLTSFEDYHIPSYFYNNTLIELLDYTIYTDNNYIKYCVKKDGEFMGNKILSTFFLEGLPYFTGSCNPVLSNYSPSVVFANETNLCFDFSLNYDDNNIIGMYNTNTSTNHFLGTFDNTGDVINWYENYTTCVNLADANVTAGDYYFYMSIPDAPYGSAYPYPFVVYEVESTPPSCTESWQPQYTTCVANNRTLYYTDVNLCGTYDNLPVNNGTITSCGVGNHITGDIAGVFIDIGVETGMEFIKYTGLMALVGLGVWLMAVL